MPEKSIEDWKLPEGGERAPFGWCGLFTLVFLAAVSLYFTSAGGKGKFDKKQAM